MAAPLPVPSRQCGMRPLPRAQRGAPHQAGAPWSVRRPAHRCSATGTEPVRSTRIASLIACLPTDVVGGVVTKMDLEPLLISVERIPGGTMLVVRGEIDLATAPLLRHELLRHLATAERLWLDLTGVTFMDSSGLHVLIASQRRADLLGAHLVIARASTAVDRVLEVTGASPLFARGAKDVDPSFPAVSLGLPTGTRAENDQSRVCGPADGTVSYPR